jgi:hypothetical protein
MVAETVVLLPGNKAQSSATQRARMCSSVRVFVCLLSVRGKRDAYREGK